MSQNAPPKQTPFIIPVFIPHKGCPHQCVFCNQHTITGKQPPMPEETIDETIQSFLAYNTAKKRTVQISFYGGTFLGLSKKAIVDYLDTAKKYVDTGRVDSIRFSTRPDTVTPKMLDLIQSYPVKTIEIGAQSMDPGVLQRSGRGHSPEQTVAAMALLKKRGYETGLQLMTGLPGDTADSVLATGHHSIRLKPDFVRLYPCVVLRGSPLETLYNRGDYRPFTLEDSVRLCARLYLMFRKNKIGVARMGLQASETLQASSQTGSELVAGPYHPAFGHKVVSLVFLNMVFWLIDTHRATSVDSPCLTITVNPKSFSKIRGIQNENIHTLKHRFGVSAINIQGDTSLDTDAVAIDDIAIDIDTFCREAA